MIGLTPSRSVDGQYPLLRPALQLAHAEVAAHLQIEHWYEVVLTELREVEEGIWRPFVASPAARPGRAKWYAPKARPACSPGSCCARTRGLETRSRQSPWRTRIRRRQPGRVPSRVGPGNATRRCRAAWAGRPRPFVRRPTMLLRAGRGQPPPATAQADARDLAIAKHEWRAWHPPPSTRHCEV